MDKGEQKLRYNLVFDKQTMPIVEQVADGMPGGFFIYRADGDEELIYTNNAVLRIFGCDTEEEFRQLTGFTFKGMVYPEDYDCIEGKIAKQIQDSEYNIDYVEYRIVQKNGSIRWVQDYGRFLHSEEYGDIFYVFIEDATERLKERMGELEEINEELRNSYARECEYKKAVLHDANAFMELNLTQDRFISASIQIADGQMHDLFGYVGMPAFEKYSDFVECMAAKMEPGEAEEYRRFFDKERLMQCYGKGELEQTYDGWVTDNSGRKKFYHYIFLLGRNEYTGNVISLFLAKDVTKQMEQQELLQEALQQAQNANIARNTFLFHMSHDVRTPLNAIIGYTELIKNHKNEPDKIDDYLDKIRISGEQLLTIVNESLEITRMESGRVKLVEREYQLETVLADVEKAARLQAEAKSIQFVVDKSKVQHFTIIGDFIRLKDILNQLIDNAVKYTEAGGDIRLSVVETDIKLKNHGKYQFIVEDNGNGISEEFLGKLFHPFQREKNTTKSGVIGTGLGLAVVKSLVDMMEGSVEVESEVGCGSRFTVNLLLRFQKEQPADRQAARQPLNEGDLKGKGILLVDDNDINREIAEEILSDLGYRVDTANDGCVALEKVKNSYPGQYSLVLMDIQMPILDGYGATKAIRKLENPALAQIPIVALSANAFAEDYGKSLDSGMNAHLPKPINIEELQEMIRTFCSQYKEEPC